MLRGIASANALLLIGSLLLPFGYLHEILRLWAPVALVTLTYTLGLLGYAARRGRRDALFLGLGTTVTILMGVADVVANMYLHQDMLLIESGCLVLLGTMALLLTDRFVRALSVAEDLTQNLARKVERRTRSLEKLNRKLRALTTQDALTDVNNRRFFDATLEREWRRSAREKQPLALIMLDLDFFKAYNDAHGHPDGDACLHRVAQAIRRCARRPADTVARYGGEEFALLLPETTGDGAYCVAERIQRELATVKFAKHHPITGAHITVSMGIACAHPPAEQGPWALVREADAALYTAKMAGRNCIRMLDEPLADPA